MGAGTERLQWVDYAKGLSILLVVHMHATLGVSAALGQSGIMEQIVHFASSFRMPLFFMLSGLFVLSVRTLDWKSFLDKRVLGLVYFFLLWTLITLIFKGYEFTGGDLSALPLLVLSSLVEPIGTLWFIYVLALFFITLRATRDLPLPILWGIAAVLNVLAIETGYAVVDGYATNLVFFVTGAVAARQIFNGAAFYEDRAYIVLPITLLAFIGNGLMFYFGFNSFPGAMLAAGLIMSYTVILFMSVVARRVSLPWLAFAGKYSIVIYLSFFIPMVVTRLALQKTGLITHPDLVSLIVWLVAAISPLIVFLLVRNTPLRFVYQRPSWVRFPKPRHPQPAE